MEADKDIQKWVNWWNNEFHLDHMVRNPSLLMLHSLMVTFTFTVGHDDSLWWSRTPLRWRMMGLHNLWRESAHESHQHIPLTDISTKALKLPGHSCAEHQILGHNRMEHSTPHKPTTETETMNSSSFKWSNHSDTWYVLCCCMFSATITDSIEQSIGGRDFCMTANHSLHLLPRSSVCHWSTS